MASPGRDAAAARLRDVRVFGLILAVFAALLYRWSRRHGLPPLATWGLTTTVAAAAVFALVAPRAARPIYRAWMALGHALGRITTPVILALVFALVFVPTRLFLRVLGRDPLFARFDRGARSYWNERERRSAAREDFERLS